MDIVKSRDVSFTLLFLPPASSDVIFGCEPSSDMAPGCLFLMWYSIFASTTTKLQSNRRINIGLCFLCGGNDPTQSFV